MGAEIAQLERDLADLNKHVEAALPSTPEALLQDVITAHAAGQSLSPTWIKAAAASLAAHGTPVEVETGVGHDAFSSSLVTPRSLQFTPPVEPEMKPSWTRPCPSRVSARTAPYWRLAVGSAVLGV